MADDLQGLGTTPEFRELLLSLQNWSTPTRFKIQLNKELFGFIGTAQQILSFTEHQPHYMEFFVSLEDLPQIFEMLTFFDDRKGMLERFWFPLPYSHFMIKSTQPSGTTELRVNSKAFPYVGHERFYILLKDESLITRHIEDVTFSNDDTVLHIQALDRTIEPDDVSLMSFMVLSRFDMDVLELKYKPYTAADCNVKLMELVNEYSEV